MNNPALPEPPAFWHGITPEQWHAEAALWEIPEADRPAAAAYELNRERIRARWELAAYQSGKAQKCHMPEPWLMLEPCWQRFERKNNIPNTLAPFPAAGLIAMLDQAGPGLSEMLVTDSQDAANKPSNAILEIDHAEAKHGEQTHESGLVCAFTVNPKAGRAELMAAFGDWLDQNDVGTQRATRGAPSELVWLRALSLHRLHRASRGDLEYWRPMAGTDFQFWKNHPGGQYIQNEITERQYAQNEITSKRWLSRTLPEQIAKPASWPYPHPAAAPDSLNQNGEIVLEMHHDSPHFNMKPKS